MPAYSPKGIEARNPQTMFVFITALYQRNTLSELTMPTAG
jgi:hypothetical protein